MRRSLPLIALLLASGCGQGGGGGGEEQASRLETTETRSFDVAEDAMSSTDAASLPAAPNISPTAAPGVAFNYRYAFRLPAASVSAV